MNIATALNQIKIHSEDAEVTEVNIAALSSQHPTQGSVRAWVQLEIPVHALGIAADYRDHYSADIRVEHPLADDAHLSQLIKDAILECI